jgi:hypothetical protein
MCTVCVDTSVPFQQFPLITCKESTIPLTLICSIVIPDQCIVSADIRLRSSTPSLLLTLDFCEQNKQTIFSTSQYAYTNIKSNYIISSNSCLIADCYIAVSSFNVLPSDRTMALCSTQPLTEMSTRSISWG